MKIFLTALAFLLGASEFVLARAQQRGPISIRSRLSNSISSVLWQSPSQLSQINSDRMDWSGALVRENLEIFAPSSRLGIVQTQQSYQLKGGYISRYPHTAAGRLGVIFDAENTHSEGFAYIANQSGQFRTHLLRTDFAPIAVQKLALSPIISYSFWEFLSIGASLEMNRRSYKSEEARFDYDSRTLHTGLSLYTSGFEAVFFASVPQSAEVRDLSQPEARFRALSNAEPGGKRIESAGALIRGNLISDWNLGYSQRVHQIRTSSGRSTAPTINEQRYMIEFAAEAGTLEAFMEWTQNFAVQWQDPEFYAGTGKRMGASLLLKTMGNARYGFSMEQTEQTGFGSLDSDSGEHDISQKSTRVQLLGYLNL